MGSTRIYPGIDSTIYPGVDPGGSQNLPLPPRFPPPFRDLLKCLRITESTHPSQNIPPFSTNVYARPSQNLPLPPKIYPPFQQLYATLPESTPPSQNIPPFLTTICDPPRIYPSFPEYTPFSSTIILCDPPIIYPSFPEYTPFSSTIILCDPPRIYPSLPEYIPLFSTAICDPSRICNMCEIILLCRTYYTSVKLLIPSEHFKWKEKMPYCLWIHGNDIVIAHVIQKGKNLVAGLSKPRNGNLSIPVATWSSSPSLLSSKKHSFYRLLQAVKYLFCKKYLYYSAMIRAWLK